MSTFQPNLFDEKELLPSGTKIKEFKKYIGIKVDAIDSSAYYKGIKKGIVNLIEEVQINGFPMYRIELDNGEAFSFGSKEEIKNFFESDLKLTPNKFNDLCNNKKVCFVSYDENSAFFLYKKMSWYNNKFASIEIEAIPHYRNEWEFYSLDRTIHYRGYNIQRVTMLEDDYYQMTKEKENSKIFHIIKNGELTTACGKKLDMHIDTQDILESASICKRCSSLFNDNLK